MKAMAPLGGGGERGAGDRRVRGRGGAAGGGQRAGRPVAGVGGGGGGVGGADRGDLAARTVGDAAGALAGAAGRGARTAADLLAVPAAADHRLRWTDEPDGAARGRRRPGRGGRGRRAVAHTVGAG